MVHFHVTLLDEASPMMGRLGESPNTLQVNRNALAEMSVPGSGISEIPPKYRVANHHAIFQKHCCDPRYYPAQMWNMVATIYELSMLQKYPMKSTSPPGSADVLPLPQSTWDEWGVHSTLEPWQVVFDWVDLIPTTGLSSMPLQSVTSGLPHPVELLQL